MKTIRRLYFYLVTLVSLEVVVWALISLARSIFDQSLADFLAGGLAFILVALPVFLFHWRFVQREATTDNEERFSGVRALFLYTAWISLAVPVVQNLLAIVMRVLAIIFDVNQAAVAIGGHQGWADNLIAILINTVLAAYIYSVLQQDWQANPTEEAFPLVRRLNRYLWVIYGLGLGYAGVLQLLLFITEKIDEIGSSSDALLVNALGLILVGVPLWLYCWRIVQSSTTDPVSQMQERPAIIRVGVLYGLTLLAAFATLLASGSLLLFLLRIAIVESETFRTAWGNMGTAISVALPSVVVWAYHWNVLKQDISKLPDEVQQHTQRRLYFYLLSLSGMAATFLSLQLLITMVVEVLFCRPVSGDVRQVCTRLLENQLPNLIAVLLVSVPLWILHWRPVHSRAVQDDEIGESARASLLRRGYLYLVLFAGVIGSMVTTGWLLFELISSILGVSTPNFTQTFLTLLGTLVLFLVFTIYHWRLLRQDGQKLDETMASRQQAFPVVVVTRDDSFAEQIRKALTALAPDVPLIIQDTDQPLAEGVQDAKAVILSADMLAGSNGTIQDWLHGFEGERLVLPTPTQGWVWLGLTEQSLSRQARQAARVVRQLAEAGEAKAGRSLSPATVLGYVLGALLGIIVICSLTSVIIELFA
jgi:hypothetical protein